MPVSRRSKVVTKSVVKKKNAVNKSSVRKDEIADGIKKALNDSEIVYVLSVQRARNEHLSNLRSALKPGKMFMAKNTIMQRALGVDPSQEEKQNLHKLSACIQGNSILVATNMNKSSITKILDDVCIEEFSRTGEVALSDVILERGFDTLDKFPGSMEPHLRSLGIPTRLVNGKIEVLTEWTLCKEGDTLRNEQCQLLKLLGIRMGEFKVDLIAHWENGKVIVA
jgi:mRNA turnover protein 4